MPQVRCLPRIGQERSADDHHDAPKQRLESIVLNREINRGAQQEDCSCVPAPKNKATSHCDYGNCQQPPKSALRFSPGECLLQARPRRTNGSPFDDPGGMELSLCLLLSEQRAIDPSAPGIDQRCHGGERQPSPGTGQPRASRLTVVQKRKLQNFQQEVSATQSEPS